MLSAFTRRISSLRSIPIRAMSAGSWGEGAGQGGGSGGTIRDAGGAFGKREAALEERYFRKMQEEQLKSLKNHMENEIRIHEQNIRLHQEAIERHKKQMHEIGKLKEKEEKKRDDD